MTPFIRIIIAVTDSLPVLKKISAYVFYSFGETVIFNFKYVNLITM